VALLELQSDGSARTFTFGALARDSNRLANALSALGVNPGDRVAIMAPQSIECALTHLAVYKLSAIAVPMSTLLGPDAVSHRLQDSGASVIVVGSNCSDEARQTIVDSGLPVISAESSNLSRHRHFWEIVRRASDRFIPADTTADSPALIIYTSGTTGSPKGAVHAHRVLIGHLPGFELSHDFFPQAGDRFWSPAEWAWIGGLMNCLLCTWFHGMPIVAARRDGPFDPEWAVGIVRGLGVRNTFLPPTALRLMHKAEVSLPAGTLRTIMSGGEHLGEEVSSWASERLGVQPNEIFGQTEANYVIGNCRSTWPVVPGSMGLPYPGHDVSVLSDDGIELAPGEIGEVGVRVPDPVAFLGYWANSDATAKKVRGDWLFTGDLASTDADGYFWFGGRSDDVISSAGYRIGPQEIEQCLQQHHAVRLAAAIGIPDVLRGEVVKAFIELNAGSAPSPELADEIRSFVRDRLAAYEYPRQIEFISQIPLTVTGKIRRSVLRERESAKNVTEVGL
jgi:acetyl-CoA synthetase